MLHSENLSFFVLFICVNGFWMGTVDPGEN